MPTYDAEFHTAAEWALLEIKAATPEKALAKARAIDPITLDFAPYDDWQPVNYITIRDADGNDLAEWLSDEIRISRVASKLLDVLEKFLAQNMGDPEDLLEGDDPLRKIYAKARAAVAELKGGAA